MPITQEIIHEAAETWNMLWKRSNINTYNKAIGFLTDRGLSKDRAEEHLAEIMTDYVINNEVPADFNQEQANFFKRVTVAFKRWIKTVFNRISYYRKNVIGQLPTEIKEQAELFVNNRWDKAFGGVKSIEEVASERYSAKVTNLFDHQNQQSPVESDSPAFQMMKDNRDKAVKKLEQFIGDSRNKLRLDYKDKVEKLRNRVQRLEEEIRYHEQRIRENQNRKTEGKFNSFGNNNETRYSVKTDTSEFKRWFGESKVVDENGKLIAVINNRTKPMSEEVLKYLN
jgi:hypothetical protein